LDPARIQRIHSVNWMEKSIRGGEKALSNQGRRTEEREKKGPWAKRASDNRKWEKRERRYSRKIPEGRIDERKRSLTDLRAREGRRRRARGIS